MVREARKEDLDALLKLYQFLHEDSILEQNAHLEKHGIKSLKIRIIICS